MNSERIDQVDHVSMHYPSICESKEIIKLQFESYQVCHMLSKMRVIVRLFKGPYYLTMSRTILLVAS